MNEIEQLLGLVTGEKAEEAKKLADAIASKITALDEAVTAQEAKKLSAIKTRDEAKSKLKEVAAELGIEEASEAVDTIKELKSKKTGDKSADIEVKNKEIEALKQEVAKVKEEFDGALAAHQEQVKIMAVEREVAAMLPDMNVVELATPKVIREIKDMSSYEDGRIIFRNPDGTTMRKDGQDLDLKGAVEKVKEENPFYFNNKVQQSGAGNTDGGNPIEGDFVP